MIYNRYSNNCGRDVIQFQNYVPTFVVLPTVFYQTFVHFQLAQITIGESDLLSYKVNKVPDILN